MTTENYFRKFVDSLFVKRRLGINGILHAAIGMSGEAGEILDIVKKVWVYGDGELDAATYDKLLEEMGDLHHYQQMMLIKMGLTFDDLRDHNVSKLQKRYPNGYTDEAAKARADKAGTDLS